MAPIFSSLLLFAAIVPSSLALIWPIPKQQSLGTEVAWLDRNIKFSIIHAPASKNSTTARYKRSVDADGVPHIRGRYTSKGGLAEQRLERAVERARKFLKEDKFVPYMINPKGFVTPVKPHSGALLVKTVTVTQTEPEPDTTKDEEFDESYTLTIKKISSSEAKVEITGKTSLGVMHGLTSLPQLFFANSQYSDVYTPYLPVDIKDSPKFSHRGVNIDVSRSYYPLEVLKGTIDRLSWNKLNRLHIHITDSQSWPLEIPSIPELSSEGSYRPEEVYTAGAIKELYEYAQLLGVKILMEIDMPGHTGSIAYSHPELIAAWRATPWENYCAQPPCGQLMLNSPKVDDFLGELFDDLLPRIKSAGATYYHTGGDEFNNNAVGLDPSVNSSDPTVIQPVLQRFMDNAFKHILSQGLTPVVWEELALKWNLTMDKSTIVQAWQDPKAVAEVVEKGYRVIAGSYFYWYLDCGHGQWLDFKPESYSTFYPFADYCSPMKNWKLVYSYDPLAGVPKEKQHLVIGGEVHIWSEQIDAQVLDARLWPRGSAAAEVLWSGNKEANGQNRTHVSITPRLAEMRERLVRRGVRASLVTQGWCLQNIGECQI
ncbi:Beta-hexosaminidase [Dactylella cylindrospora]|nr:Beta-hexosaminidase [Dactylella cylindrospora]